MEAQYRLGRAYHGYGCLSDGVKPLIERDIARSMAWFHRAAEQGHAGAQYYLGKIYNEGRKDDGVNPNYIEAAAWYRKAAEQEHGLAQVSLGRMYEYGNGVSQDDAEAIVWYRKAARHRGNSAQSSLDRMLAEGRGVQPSEAQAVAASPRETQTHTQAASTPRPISWIGIRLGETSLSDLNEEVRQLFKNAIGDIPAQGREIKTVVPFSPAGRSIREPGNAWIFNADDGLRILYKIGDTYINSPSDVDNIVRAAEPGTHLMLHLALIGLMPPFPVHPHQMEITVQALPPALIEAAEREMEPLLGMTFDDEIIDQHPVVKVTSVANDSPAWRAGIRPGAYIVGKRLTPEQYRKDLILIPQRNVTPL